jgi:23S rRNA pseudouridine955/2504/2580 synthase
MNPKYQNHPIQQNSTVRVEYRTIALNDEGQRLDNYLFRILKGVPKSCIYRLIRDGQVRVNKKRAKPMTRLMEHDQVRIPPVRQSQAEHQPLTLSSQQRNQLLQTIIYEDDALLVINKPSGMAVHGGSGIQLGVIEALRLAREDLHYIELVHRLDKETSGCLLLAKKKSSLRSLQAMFEAKTIQKTYVALLHGSWQGKTVCYVDAALSKQRLQSGERQVKVDEQGKASKTRFILLKNYESCCLVSASPKTGRTHQIRVHSASMHHPIVGDSKYIHDDEVHLASLPKRLYLHAYAIRFKLNEQDFQFVAPLTDVFLQGLNQLESGEQAFNELELQQALNLSAQK